MSSSRRCRASIMRAMSDGCEVVWPVRSGSRSRSRHHPGTPRARTRPRGTERSASRTRESVTPGGARRAPAPRLARAQTDCGASENRPPARFVPRSYLIRQLSAGRSCHALAPGSVRPPRSFGAGAKRAQGCLHPGELVEQGSGRLLHDLVRLEVSVDEELGVEGDCDRLIDGHHAEGGHDLL